MTAVDQKRTTYQQLAAVSERDLLGSLKQRVIGQEAGAQKIVRLVILALRRALALMDGTGPDFLPQAGSFLVMGPTASGKSYICRLALELAGLPTFTVDCSNLTGAGWKGNDVQRELADVALWQRDHPGEPCAVLWDEADKLAKAPGQADSFSPARDLLKWLDGGSYLVRGAGEGEDVWANASLVVNVFMGAFSSIGATVLEREARAAAAGAGEPHDAVIEAVWSLDQQDEARERATTEDLCAWGLPREFCGRMGSVVALGALPLSDMVRILQEGETSTRAKCGRLLPHGCAFVIEPAAAKVLAFDAVHSGIGVRSLECQVMPLLAEALPEALTNEYVSQVRLQLVGGVVKACCIVGDVARESALAGQETAAATSTAQAWIGAIGTGELDAAEVGAQVEAALVQAAVAAATDAAAVAAATGQDAVSEVAATGFFDALTDALMQLDDCEPVTLNTASPEDAYARISQTLVPSGMGHDATVERARDLVSAVLLALTNESSLEDDILGESVAPASSGVIDPAALHLIAQLKDLVVSLSADYAAALRHAGQTPLMQLLGPDALDLGDLPLLAAARRAYRRFLGSAEVEDPQVVAQALGQLARAATDPEAAAALLQALVNPRA